MRHSPAPVASCLLAALVALAAPLPAFAAGEVGPGQTLTFSASDYGTRECRRGSARFDCLGTLSPSRSTGWNATLHRVQASAVYTTGRTAHPVPVSAKGMLHHTFDLRGKPGHMVNVQVSATYDIDPVSLLMSGNSYAEVTLQLEVRDITNSPGFTVTAFDLWNYRRDNTQGFTDIASAQERQVKTGENAHFSVMLVTGRRYAVTFAVEVMSGNFLGVSDVLATAYWRRLSVAVDNDELALIDDLAISLMAHDEDIRARLNEVNARLEAIENMLRRPVLRPGQQPLPVPRRQGARP